MEKNFKIEYGTKSNPQVKYFTSLGEVLKELSPICKSLFWQTEKLGFSKSEAYVKLYKRELGLWTLEKSITPEQLSSEENRNIGADYGL